MKVQATADEASILQMSDNVSMSLFLKTPPETSRTGAVREVSISRREGIKMRVIKTEGGATSEVEQIGTTLPDTADPLSLKNKLENIQSGHLKIAEDVITH